jgi:hypothetical protein
MIESGSKPQRKPDYRLEMIDGELLLYHLNQTQILYCNQTASLIWNLCDGKLTVNEIIDLLQEAYPEAAGAIASDVQTTLRIFLDNDSIVLT